MKGTASGRKLAWLVLLAALAAFAPSLSGRFLNCDDNWLVEKNRTIRSLSAGGVARMFDPAADRTWYGAEYLPLRDLSYALDFAAWRRNPVGFRLTGILLYALTSFLVVLWLGELTGRPGVAAAAGLLFALHPVHSESVAWIAGRKDLLCGFFFFLGLFLHRRALRAGPRAAVALETAACLSAAASMLSKAMGVVYPAALLVADWIYPVAGDVRRKLLDGRLVVPVLATGLAAAGFSMIHAHVAKEFLIHPYAASRLTVLATMAAVTLSYLQRLTLPIGLSPVADFPFRPFPDPAAIAGTVVLAAALTGLAHGLRQRKRLGPAGRSLVFAGLWIGVTMAPFSNVLPFRHLLADRYLYLASAGFAFAAAEILLLVRGRRAAAIFGAVAVAFGALSLDRARVWRDPRKLWEDALERDPRNHFLHLYLGDYLASIDPGDRVLAQSARREFELALAHPPRSTPFTLAQARVNLANLEFAWARLDEAEFSYRAAAEIEPTLTAAWAGLGNVAKARGELRGAVRFFRQALVYESEDPVTTLALAGCHFVLGEDDRARVWFEKAAGLDPSSPLPREGLAELDRRKGDFTAALAHLDAAIACAPDLPRLHLSRAEVLLDAGDASSARESLSRARELLDRAGVPWTDPDRVRLERLARRAAEQVKAD